MESASARRLCRQVGPQAGFWPVDMGRGDVCHVQPGPGTSPAIFLEFSSLSTDWVLRSSGRSQDPRKWVLGGLFGADCPPHGPAGLWHERQSVLGQAPVIWEYVLQPSAYND